MGYTNKGETVVALGVLSHLASLLPFLLPQSVPTLTEAAPGASGMTGSVLHASVTYCIFEPCVNSAQ